MEKSGLSCPHFCPSLSPPVRERGQSPYLGGQIIQLEFSGLRAIPLDPFDVFHFCSASFLPYFMLSSVACRGTRCKFAHPSPRNRLEISQTGIARHNQNYYISFRAFLPPCSFPVLSLSLPVYQSRLDKIPVCFPAVAHVHLRLEI